MANAIGQAINIKPTIPAIPEIIRYCGSVWPDANNILTTSITSKATNTLKAHFFPLMDLAVIIFLHFATPRDTVKQQDGVFLLSVQRCCGWPESGTLRGTLLAIFLNPGTPRGNPKRDVACYLAN